MTIDNSILQRRMHQNHQRAIIAKRQAPILGPPASHNPAPAPAPGPATTRDPATTAPTSAAAATTPATRTTPSSTAADPDTRTSQTAAAATDRSTRTVTSTSTASRSISTGVSVGALTLISNGLSASSGLLSISSDASASAPAASSGGGGGGPSAGTVVGIVAGALVGVIFVSAVVGYVFRAKWGSSKEEEDRYGDVLKTRDEYRRESRMLGDGSDSASDFGGAKLNDRDRDMQSVSGSPVLNRSNTNRSNGSHYAPSMHHGHNPYLHPGMSAAPPLPPVMPSFRPGQVVTTPFYNMPPGAGQRALSPAPMMPQRALSPGPMPGMAYPGAPGGYQDFGAFYGQPPQPPRSPGPNGGYGELNRSPTHHQQGFGAPPPPHMHMGMGMGMPPNRTPSPLMRVQQTEMQVPSRSGTPENSNVQMVFHRGHDSASVMGHGQGMGGRNSDGSVYGNGNGGANGGGYQAMGGDQMEGGRVEKDVRAKRTLSVRNGGLDDFGSGNGNGNGATHGKKDQRPISTMTDASDAYGGM